MGSVSGMMGANLLLLSAHRCKRAGVAGAAACLATVVHQHGWLNSRVDGQLDRLLLPVHTRRMLLPLALC